MKKNLLLSSLLLVLAACRPVSPDISAWKDIVYEPAEATGFVICGAPGYKSTLLRVFTPWQGADGTQTLVFMRRAHEPVPSGFTGQVIEDVPRSVACMSSSHIAMLDALGCIDCVTGVSGLDYVSNPVILSCRENKDKAALPAHTVADVGYDGNVNYEALLARETDLVLLYGVNSACAMEGKLKELGIPFAYIGEYIESSPLGKTEWVVVLGEIMGKREDAAALFKSEVSRYQTYKWKANAHEKSPSPARPRVMVNTPYGDIWFMPSSQSYIARFIADAGGDYVCENITGTASKTIDLEEAYLLASSSDCWIQTGSCNTLKELKTACPKFADTRPVTTRRVFNSTRRMTAAGGNDYWESGVMNPHLILRDLVKIFHPGAFPEDTLYYHIQLP